MVVTSIRERHRIHIFETHLHTNTYSLYIYLSIYMLKNVRPQTKRIVGGHESVRCAAPYVCIFNAHQTTNGYVDNKQLSHQHKAICRQEYSFFFRSTFEYRLRFLYTKITRARTVVKYFFLLDFILYLLKCDPPSVHNLAVLCFILPPGLFAFVPRCLLTVVKHCAIVSVGYCSSLSAIHIFRDCVILMPRG